MAKRVNLTSGGSSSKYSKYLYKSNKKAIIAAVASVVAVLGVVVVVGVQMHNKSKIDSAKSLMKNFDDNNRVISVDINPSQDSDSDGVSNGDEISDNTDYLLADTDGDGINDGAEKNIKTDPLNPDTDGDGLGDGIEIMAGLDPNSKLTEGIDDTERKFTVSKINEELTAEITGNASVYGALVEKVNLTGFSANSSILTDVYDVYNHNGFDSCKLTFTVNDKNVTSDVSVVRFNVSDGSFEKIDSVYDEASKTISANITENGTYMVADNKTIDSESKTRVHFLIDNSGSMYSQDLIPNSPENDVYFKRLDFAKQLVEKFDDSYTVAISRFTKDYHYMQEFTNDKKRLKDILDNIKTLDEDFNGTYIQYSLEECMKSFTDTEEKTVNIIILVTDGDTTEEKTPDTDYIAKLAKEKNIIILTVSIGNNIDKSILNEIAQKTDGKYYSASDANFLDQIHSQIVATLDYDKTTVGSSNSYTSIGYTIYNTGFVPAENGFGFVDYRTSDNDSVSFGLNVFAKKWFTDTLPMSMGEMKSGEKTVQGYGLSGTDFETQYNNRKKLRGLSFVAVTTSRFIDSSKYLDYKNSDTSTVYVDSEIRLEANKKGWTEKRFLLNKPILDWNSVNLLALDVENKSDKIEDAYGKSEAEFYKAVNRFNAEITNQGAFVNLSSGEAGFNAICDDLKNGEPAVVVINGNYSLLVTSMIKNSDKPDEYVLRVYDPSEKDVVKELYITKTIGCKINLDGTVNETTCYYNGVYNSEDVSVLVYTN